MFESFEAESRLAAQLCLISRILKPANASAVSPGVRGLAVPALENMVTWHERDLTSLQLNVSCCLNQIFCDYILNLMTGIVANLRVDEQRMMQI